jgi:oxygen-independent coproporphyrinogen-3 oxidase
MTSPVEVQPDEQAKTTVGNYFVANYPPFSFWKPERRGEVFTALAQPPLSGTPLGIYVHLPFCRKRCHFCYFRVYTAAGAKRDRVAAYVDAVLHELQLYAQTPLVSGRHPRYVYFGGGTPSFLSVEQLTQLFTGMKRLLPWDDVEEVTFECEPGTLTDEKLQALRELGVTRLSLGIENFDDEILRSNGRAHLSKEIYRAYQFARSIDFKQINVDLIAGMLNETAANWQQCIRKVIDLAADCVTIYQMEIPFNTTIYRQMHERGEIVAPVADWPTKRAWVHDAYAELERAGYTVSSAYTAVRDPQAFRFLYRDYLWKGADMVSLGLSSFGHFRGTHYQNEKDIGPYLDRLGNGELPIHRALAMTEDEKLIREVILQMKLGGLDRNYFREKFATDILTRFAVPLAKLGDAGFVTIVGDRVLLDRQGLLRVDELLGEFFLPQHVHVRYT